MRQLLAAARSLGGARRAPASRGRRPADPDHDVAMQADKRTIVHLLNQGSSWGMHSTYQKLARLPEELNKQWGFPNQSELRDMAGARGGHSALGHSRPLPRARRDKGHARTAAIDLPITRPTTAWKSSVNDLGMHAMVVFDREIAGILRLAGSSLPGVAAARIGRCVPTSLRTAPSSIDELWAGYRSVPCPSKSKSSRPGTKRGTISRRSISPAKSSRGEDAHLGYLGRP